jgi:hypothetical protein
MNLIYAEATLRGGSGGSLAKTLDYVNKLRVRAYGNNSGNLTNLSLDDILNERVKELYWEGFRRSDLIRYGKLRVIITSGLLKVVCLQVRQLPGIGRCFHFLLRILLRTQSCTESRL